MTAPRARRPAWKLRAFAKTAASDSRVAAFSAVAIAWCAIALLWSLVLTASDNQGHDTFVRSPPA